MPKQTNHQSHKNSRQQTRHNPLHQTYHDPIRTSGRFPPPEGYTPHCPNPAYSTTILSDHELSQTFSEFLQTLQNHASKSLDVGAGICDGNTDVLDVQRTGYDEGDDDEVGRSGGGGAGNGVEIIETGDVGAVEDEQVAIRGLESGRRDIHTRHDQVQGTTRLGPSTVEAPKLDVVGLEQPQSAQPAIKNKGEIIVIDSLDEDDREPPMTPHQSRTTKIKDNETPAVDTPFEPASPSAKTPSTSPESSVRQNFPCEPTVTDETHMQPVNDIWRILQNFLNPSQTSPTPNTSNQPPPSPPSSIPNPNHPASVLANLIPAQREYLGNLIHLLPVVGWNQEHPWQNPAPLPPEWHKQFPEGYTPATSAGFPVRANRSAWEVGVHDPETVVDIYPEWMLENEPQWVREVLRRLGCLGEKCNGCKICLRPESGKGKEGGP